MNNSKFILIAALIFTAKFFLASLFPFLLLADPFIILALTAFFLKDQKVHLVLFVAIALFFDFWSGEVFGVATLSLLVSVLIIFLVKKVIMIDQKGWWANLFWIVIFYYLNSLLLNLVLAVFVFKIFIFYGIYLFWFNLVGVIFWAIVIMFLVKRLSHEKRVSSF